MNTAGLLALLPFLLIAGTAVFVMLAIAAWRRHWLSLCITLVGIGGSIRLFVACGAAGASQGDVAPHPGPVRTVLYRPDHCGHVCHRDSLLWVSPAPLGDSRRTLRSASGGNARFDGFGGEQPLRFLLSWVGNPERGTVRAVRLPAHSPPPLEAGIKYLILAGSSSAFLLFGMALIYAQTGTMELFRLAALLGGAQNNPLVLAGLTFIVTGIGFKLGVVPFHLWTPGCL